MEKHNPNSTTLTDKNIDLKCTVCLVNPISNCTDKDPHYLKLLQFYWDGLDINLTQPPTAAELPNQALCDQCLELLNAFYDTNDVLVYLEKRLRIIHNSIVAVTLNGIKQQQAKSVDTQDFELELGKGSEECLSEVQQLILQRWSGHPQQQLELALVLKDVPEHDSASISASTTAPSPMELDFTEDDYCNLAVSDQLLPIRIQTTCAKSKLLHSQGSACSPTDKYNHSSYNCHICSIPCSTTSELKSHLIQYHSSISVPLVKINPSSTASEPVSEESWSPCSICNHWYRTNKLLKHTSTCQLKLKCKVQIEINDNGFKQCEICKELILNTGNNFEVHFQRNHGKLFNLPVLLKKNKALSILTPAAEIPQGQGGTNKDLIEVIPATVSAGGEPVATVADTATAAGITQEDKSQQNPLSYNNQQEQSPKEVSVTSQAQGATTIPETTTVPTPKNRGRHRFACNMCELDCKSYLGMVQHRFTHFVPEHVRLQQQQELQEKEKAESPSIEAEGQEQPIPKRRKRRACSQSMDRFNQQQHEGQGCRRKSKQDLDWSPRPFRCTKCNKNISTRYALEHHLLVAHPLNGIKPKFYRCKYCPQSYAASLSVKSHLRKVHTTDILPNAPSVAAALLKEDVVTIGGKVYTIWDHIFKLDPIADTANAAAAAVDMNMDVDPDKIEEIAAAKLAEQVKRAILDSKRQEKKAESPLVKQRCQPEKVQASPGKMLFRSPPPPSLIPPVPLVIDLAGDEPTQMPQLVAETEAQGSKPSTDVNSTPGAAGISPTTFSVTTAITPPEDHVSKNGVLSPSPNWKLIKCMDCKQTFMRDTDLKFHLQTAHPENHKQITTCHICNAPFKTRRWLHFHLVNVHGLKLGKLGDHMEQQKHVKDINATEADGRKSSLTNGNLNGSTNNSYYQPKGSNGLFSQHHFSQMYSATEETGEVDYRNQVLHSKSASPNKLRHLLSSPWTHSSQSQSHSSLREVRQSPRSLPTLQVQPLNVTKESQPSAAPATTEISKESSSSSLKGPFSKYQILHNSNVQELISFSIERLLKKGSRDDDDQVESAVSWTNQYSFDQVDAANSIIMAGQQLPPFAAGAATAQGQNQELLEENVRRKRRMMINVEIGDTGISINQRHRPSPQSAVAGDCDNGTNSTIACNRQDDDLHQQHQASAVCLPEPTTNGMLLDKLPLPGVATSTSTLYLTKLNSPSKNVGSNGSSSSPETQKPRTMEITKKRD